MKSEQSPAVETDIEPDADDAAESGHRLKSNSARRALDILGDRWTLMILHLAFKRVRRFDDFRARIGIARSLLTDRLRRMEVAGMIAFLCSPAAAYVNGQSIAVDGGRMQSI